MNKVILLGRMGRDPEIKTVGQDNSVATFSIATSEYWKDKQGEFQERTEWHNIVAWGHLAQKISEKGTKGDLVLVEGKIQTRSWDGTDGAKHYKTEINAQSLRVIKTLPGGGAGQQPSGSSGNSYDDMPF